MAGPETVPTDVEEVVAPSLEVLLETLAPFLDDGLDPTELAAIIGRELGATALRAVAYITGEATPAG